jgi:hypothetical protein
MMNEWGILKIDFSHTGTSDAPQQKNSRSDVTPAIILLWCHLKYANIPFRIGLIIVCQMCKGSVSFPHYIQ